MYIPTHGISVRHRLLVARFAVEALEALADAGCVVAVAAPGAVPAGLIPVPTQGVRSGHTFLQRIMI
jgi:hypothetical protein